MTKLNLADVTRYVEENIGVFHAKRLQSLDKLKLESILKRKNPYLFRAKYMLTSEQIIRGLLDAYISSNEETIFGDWMEGLAIFINAQVFDGKKSGIPGVDLEFEHDHIRYIIAIKSGPNWGNSSQIKKMEADFNSARKVLRTSGAKVNVVAVNGCCYGRDNHPDKGSYQKLCGQRFWEFISGDPELYIKIIEPLGHLSREKNESFMQAYAQAINRFVVEFAKDFCNAQGAIDWPKLVAFNSANL
ncbi:MAG: cytosolic protein [Bernardetiaceae bacterium]|jgi:hypothetical protein|nr:cytosolic protein [Bernardetiaceae bacterium]